MLYPVANYNVMSVGMRAALVVIPTVAKTVSSVAVPIIAVIGLSRIPLAAAKHSQPQWEPGPEKDAYADCFQKCLDRKDPPIVTLLCQALCALLS